MANTRKSQRQRQTRRRSQRAGGIFGFGGPSVKQQATSAAVEAQYKRNQNLAKSKARVANILGTPGEFKYTNKERIESEFQSKIAAIEAQYGITHEEILDGVADAQSLGAKDVTGTLRDMKNRLEEQIVAVGPTAAAVTLTIPVGLAQIAVKVFRIMLAIAIFMLATIPAGLMGVNATTTSMAMSAVLPNTNFTTTKNSFAFLKDAFKRKNNRGAVSATV
jgi:hypothetical protein